jgi:hypothetical protein
MAKYGFVRPTSTTHVTLRRLARDFPPGAGNKGDTVLILNPKVFGSLGDNWLGRRSYETPDEAMEAAAKAGVKMVSIPITQALRVFRATAKDST